MYMEGSVDKLSPKLIILDLRWQLTLVGDFAMQRACYAFVEPEFLTAVRPNGIARIGSGNSCS